MKTLAVVLVSAFALTACGELTEAQKEAAALKELCSKPENKGTEQCFILEQRK